MFFSQVLRSAPILRQCMSAFVFDWDGTLINSVQYRFGVLRRLFEKLGAPLTEGDIHSLPSGVSFPGVVDHVSKKKGVQLPVKSVLVSLWETENIKQIPSLYPGVYDGLVGLKRHGAHLAIASNQTSGILRHELQHYHLEGLFDAVLSLEDSQYEKPNPDMLYKAIDRLGCTADQAIMVGDSVADQVVAINAGVGFVSVNAPALVGGFGAFHAKDSTALFHYLSRTFPSSVCSP